MRVIATSVFSIVHRAQSVVATDQLSHRFVELPCADIDLRGRKGRSDQQQKAERRRKQEVLFYATERAEAPGHPFYQRLNRVLDRAGFDEFCEKSCEKLYRDRLGRPSMAPGVYFRLLLIGFFEGLESERGIAWRVADSLSLRRFLRYGLDETTPDHPRRSPPARGASRDCRL